MIPFEQLTKADIRLVQAGMNALLRREVALKIDGIWGPASRAAYDDYHEPSVYTSGFDERTEKNLATLHPKARPAFRSFVKMAKEKLKPLGLDYIVISRHRTYEEQNALYAKGRTVKGDDVTPSRPMGRTVTDARGGRSNHNFAVAMDDAIFLNGKYLDGGTATDRGKAEEARKLIEPIGKALGLEWGGDWRSFPDPPHWEFPTGLTMAEMRQRAAEGKSVL